MKNGESPQWVKARLSSIGLRPISALVDITNYSTIALNRPLHVFDADKIKGDIQIRLARNGEKMQALDGKEYILDNTMTVISDDEDAEALAGVMGGERTGVSEQTINVMLETAYFNPVRTAMTGRKLNLMSDARFRFERGVDPAFLEDGTEIASQLILDLCGGEASNIIKVGSEPNWKRNYFLNKSRVEKLGGLKVTPKRTEEILKRLGFGIKEVKEGWETSVPSWRYDVVGEADLVEEVLRINGFDKIPTVSMTRKEPLPGGAVSITQERRSRARRTLAGRGMDEVVTFSFLKSEHASLFGNCPEVLKLINPISTDLDMMRPSILPNLNAAAGRNADRGHNNIAFFEIGPQFAGENPDDEIIVATGIRSLQAIPRNWRTKARNVDVFDVKADVLSVIRQIGSSTFNAKIIQGNAANWYHPGRSGTIGLGPKVTLAQFGELHPVILQKMDVQGPVVAFEIYIDNVPLPKGKRKDSSRPALNLSLFQAVERDFSFVVNTEISAQDLMNTVRSADENLIVNVNVFDVFTDESIADNRKSLGISVILQSNDGTLTDEEIENVSNKIKNIVHEKTGGTLRG